MSHMNTIDREEIERLLSMNLSTKEIAKRIKRAKSTIIREIVTRSVECNRNYKCSNRICANYETCQRIKGYGYSPQKSFRNTPNCFNVCPEFVERKCEMLVTPSHVCNGCKDFYNCPMMKRIYVANGAQANYTGILHESRSGVHPDDETIQKMNEIISSCIKKGQSIRHIVHNNPDAFKNFKERTIYDYIYGGLFDITRADLPEACYRKLPSKKKETKTKAKCRIGRTYKEYVLFCKTNNIEECVELDTVCGEIDGKVLFTMYLPGGLMIAFLRDRKSSQTCTRIFNYLWELCGEDFFRELFFVILTDNGSEFCKPTMIENYRPNPEHNSTKLVSRGVRVFYCDPYCSSQKPHVERYHRELRRILEHGTSFDSLTQEDINLVLSHINSYSRGVIDDSTAYDKFIQKYGERGKNLLNKLGIVKIHPNEVTLDPILLGEKFKKHADEVILKKYGVVSSK